MNETHGRGSTVMPRVLSAAASESRVVAAIRRRRVDSTDHGRRGPDPAKVSGRSDDAPLIHLVDTSVPFRAIARAGEWTAGAWSHSATAALFSSWLTIPLARRVRLVAIVLIAAVLTHVALTGFRAPEPTLWARGAWIAIVLTVLVVGVCARGVAAAWRDWTLPPSLGARPNNAETGS